MKQAFARNWHWFLVAAVLLDLVIATLPHINGDMTAAMVATPMRWLVMGAGVFAMRWAQQSGTLSKLSAGWAASYLVFGFTAAALLGGVFTA